ncbi:nucleotidyltransferase [Geomonas terrae]|uniref:Nucleotidyltransferase n=1 Tax=Geomonas terrae TaxID=2562681 RepID=A0A4S1CBF5_9BACT|nr:putative nucleotidyltransferase substrate binding domain-containing protein [Geomonas terrae]TGU70685.1 nucleotidyltransferase [Geomonas terrae]
MPMLLGSKGEDILTWRASTELLENLKTRLERKWESSSSRAAESFLTALMDTLRAELDYEGQLDQELAAVEGEIARAETASALAAPQQRYRELAAAHFRRRGSPLALCGACSRLHDLVLKKTAELAEERMRELGQGTAPVYALLVSGDRARGEQTLYSRNRYLLLHQLDSERFYLFSRQFTLALQQSGLLGEQETPWHGSLSEWRSLLKNGNDKGETPPVSPAPLPPFAAAERQRATPLPEWRWRLESMADLAYVAGFEPLADQAVGAATLALREELGRDPFFQLARRVISLPLALGRFGRWRLEQGEHHGEIDIERLALSPLVQLVRILSLKAQVHEGGTLQRIRALLYRGAMDVDLAERLLKALQCLLALRIENEIRSEGPGGYANPEDFALEQDARLREALEAVLNLQKIAYQNMVGQV